MNHPNPETSTAAQVTNVAPNQGAQGVFNAPVTINPPPISCSSAQARRNRSRMLAKVRDYWIAGVLDKSLHGAALIALGKEVQPDAVTHPWQVLVQEVGVSPHTLEPDTPIQKI